MQSRPCHFGKLNLNQPLGIQSYKRPRGLKWFRIFNQLSDHIVFLRGKRGSIFDNPAIFIYPYLISSSHRKAEAADQPEVSKEVLNHSHKDSIAEPVRPI